MGRVFTLSLTAALNPTLLAAVTVMLTLSAPKRLLSGYLAGALITSLTCGLLLVFALGGSTSSSAKHSVDPVLNIVLGAIVLLVAFIVATGRDKRRQARSARKREENKNKPPPRWKQELSKGSARSTFLIGIVLSFPGASYIAGMDLLGQQHLSTSATVLAVIGFNLIMLLLLELPLIGFATKPEWTTDMVARFNLWLVRSGSRVALIGAGLLGVVLVGRGVLNW